MLLITITILVQVNDEWDKKIEVVGHTVVTEFLLMITEKVQNGRQLLTQAQCLEESL